MKYLSVVLFVLSIPSILHAEESKQWEWNELTALIGSVMNEQRVNTFFLEAGRFEKSTYSGKDYFDFESQGICLEVVDLKVRGIFLQIAPGKPADARQYYGTLPFDLKTIRNSPKQAISIFGNPVSREGNISSFIIKGYLFQFIYQPQLDFIRIYNENSDKK
jgi:hypothetical protein